MTAKRPQDWTAEEKLNVVIEAATVPEEELGAFLRRKGLHEAQLKEWRQIVLSGLEKRPARPTKSRTPEARRVRELERELARKDKALAEAAALLVLKKEAQAIWGDEDDATALTLVDEAVRSGARLELAAQALGLTARTFERWRRHGRQGGDRRCGPKSAPPNRLSEFERRRVLELVNAPEYRDLSPKQIVPRLLDEKSTYVASESTIYRLLRAEGQMAHRELSRPATSKRPREQVATGSNQVWSWDITWLPGPVRGTFFYLYLVLDVWSRKIVGGAVHTEENSALASQLVVQICRRLGLDPEGLVLHSDNGSPMKGSTMLATLRDLGVMASFSRPRVSDDNPFSESLFRTMKYRPCYPSRPFSSLEEAQAWVERFIEWYNTEHRHSAIRYVTPSERHHGQETAILERRRRIYERARQRRPERWSRGIRNWTPVAVVRLNPDPKAAELRDAA